MMRNVIRGGSLAALVLASTSNLLPASAQDLSARPDMQAFDVFLNTNQPLADARAAHMRQMRDTRYPDCAAEPAFVRVPPDQSVSLGLSWAPLAAMPAAPARDGAPYTGVWQETYEVSYCGTEVTENAVVGFESADAAPRMGWLPPGHSQADITLTRDLIQQLALYSLAMNTQVDPPCEGVMNPMAAILDTAVTTPQENGGRWVEVWTIHHCQQTLDLQITLTPSPQGGTDYAIQPLD